MFDWILSHPYQVVGLLLPIVIPLVVFQILPLLVLLERRGAGFIQDRAGPNRAYVYIPVLGIKLRAFGMIYNATDAIKCLFKENFIPPFVHKGFYLLSPGIPVITGLLGLALIPWFSPIIHATGRLSGQIVEANSGILMLFAMGGLGVYGVVLGSWASNSKYALLGGMRASAMMISYEVSMGLSVMGMLLLVGSLSLTDVAEWQTAHTWGIVVQPIGFLLFLVSMFAECNRNPFDVAEGESELIAGFHTEFNGVKFMTFMTAEYLHVIAASVLVATIYLGGYGLLPMPLPLHGFDAPWVTLDTTWLKGHIGLVGGLMLIPAALGLLGFAYLLTGRRARVNNSDANAVVKAERNKEYTLYIAAFSLLGLGLLGGAAALLALLRTEGLATTVDGVVLWPGWVNAVAAFIQFNILIGKALAICWLFVWVRWTLPRFRYDQIMDLGWKVMLNIALVNLLVTAVIAKLVR
jgi:NADH-quinone oxidoreductase subunit H